MSTTAPAFASGPAPLPAPAIFPAADGAVAFSPDGTTMLFAHSVGKTVEIDASHFAGGSWSTPAIAPFSGKWNDWDPAFAPDGSYVVFVSGRPVPGSAEKTNNLWRTDLHGDTWSEPVHLPPAVNIASYIFAPSIASDGTIYFLRSSKQRVHQLCRARLQNGMYQQAEPLTFSSPANDDYDPETAPDQSFVIFASDHRKGTDTNEQLYIVFAHGDGWGAVQPLHYSGDDTSNDGSPVLSPDGKTLYFVSDRRYNNTTDGRVWALPIGQWIDAARKSIP